MATGFTTQNGQIIGPNGKPFVAHGINLDSDLIGQAITGTGATPLTTDFPGVNFIRLNIANNGSGSLPSLSSIEQQINEATAKGIVVEIEFHPYQFTLSGSQLASVAAWYGAAAKAFAGNPYVWFGSQNEPDNGGTTGISTEMTTLYNAVRGNGNTQPFLLTPRGGGVDTTGMSQSAIQGMSNVVWDLHYYNWVSGYSTSVAVNESALNNEISTFKSFDNIPAIVAEYGDSTGGDGTDPGWQATVQAVNTDPNTSGSAAWAWNPGDNTGDDLFSNNVVADGLSAYGQMVAGYIKAAAGTTGSSGGTTGSGGGSTESPNSTTDVPGSGSITDAKGNIFTLQGGTGTPLENGVGMPGGIASDEEYYYNHALYTQSAANQSWSTWNGTAFVASGTPPGLTTTGGGSGDVSPSGTVITPGSGTITDTAGNLYILTSGDVAEENGKPIPGGYGTSKMEFYNGQIYGQDANSHLWYTWDQHNWNPANAPPSGGSGSGSGGASPSGTIITPGHGTFTDSAGNHYTLTLADIAKEDGSAIPGGSGTSEMEYYGGQVYGQDANSHTWYIWNQHTWTASAAPHS